ncbi:hypothetical protein [Chryseobacterium echinoideorum]|uniref:hypothetical protein n=1 Tax=Chryseobacterium echinoideorum TaxID=1549648 RepID=UPI001186E3DD|nr:hypothetical protein [Chryseobacterium echinoideorum]
MKLSSNQLTILEESCLLGIQQYDYEKSKEEGKIIVNQIEKNNLNFTFTAKQTKLIGSFLANWHKQNEEDLTDLQTIMFNENYKANSLLHLQEKIKRLNTFVDLLKIFNNNFYKSFFEGTEENYRKKLTAAQII